MKTWVKLSLTSLGLISVGVGLAVWSNSLNWNSETARLIRKIKQAAFAGETKTVSFEEFDMLPAPVNRYFRFALKDGQPIIRVAAIKHAGEFNLNNRWISFESTQHFSANPPAFVWDAGMKINPLMNIRVRDGYSNGQGSMLAKLHSVYTVMKATGEEKLTAGALQRYLAEAVWLPTALLPSENLKWGAIDERRALATLTDAGVTVSLEFRFNKAGHVTGIFSPTRFREVNGKYKPFPWAGRFWAYDERNEMMIPVEGEVEWQLPEGNAPYWRGRIVDVDYDFAP